jgi:hypothetical protein
MMKLARWMAVVVVACALQAAAQCPPGSGNMVLRLNEANPSHVDLLFENQAANFNCPGPASTLKPGFLVQGHKMELRVFNRKFLTDYSISIDAVTELQTGPNIRNLNEAENLTLGPASLASIPLSKGGAEGLTPRTADKILFDLIDETKATGPQTDLNNDHDFIERERAKTKALVQDFEERYTLLRGPNSPVNVDCHTVLGAPSVQTLSVCLGMEEKQAPWAGPGPYTDESEFRNANTRVQDLIASVITLAGQLAGTDLVKRLADLGTAITQYENDLNTYKANAEAARDAVFLAQTMVDESFRKDLRRQQMKVMLMDKLKGSDSKPVLDEAEMNALLDRYERAYGIYEHQYPPANHGVPQDRWRELQDLASNYLSQMHPVDEFRHPLERNRTRMELELPGDIAHLNSAQSSLLNRVNYIYDHSQVPEPLPKQIDLSGHSGNLIVYYTIRRIETFQRYTVAPVQGPGSAQAVAAQGAPLPSSIAAAPGSGNPAPGAAGNTAANPAASTTAAPQSGGNGSPSGSGQNGQNLNQGVVVARGSFEVHDVFHANVVAAVAFSTLKDQSIAKQPQPQSCTGTPSNPDPNCFSPSVSSSFQWAPIVGLDYYFQPRDTFPRANGAKWFCIDYPWQCFGVMGAASVTKANNYLLGGFFEPALSVQIGVGANFGTKTVLQSPYKNGVPVDITGDFPTTDQRGTGLFVSAGLDLGIFRKIFGKVTGIGTSASGTSGK